MVKAVRFRVRIGVLFLLSTIMLVSILGVHILRTGFNEVTIEEMIIERPGRGTIAFTLYRPSAASISENLPLVLTLHGVCGSKGGLHGLNLELARRNFSVVSIDLPGHGSSPLIFNLTDLEGMRDDCIAVLQHTESALGFNLSRYGVVGHSLGGVLAYYLASSSVSPQCVVSIGSTGGSNVGVSPAVPDNLLLAIGTADEVITEDEALGALRSYSSNMSAVAGITYGSFSAGNASKLVFSNGNHVSEASDPVIISEAIEWLSLSLVDGYSSSGELQVEMVYTLLGTAITMSAMTLYASTFLVFMIVHSLVKQSGRIDGPDNDPIEINVTGRYQLSYLSSVAFAPLIIIGCIGEATSTISFHDFYLYGPLLFCAAYTLLLFMFTRPLPHLKLASLRRPLARAFLTVAVTVTWFAMWMNVGIIIATGQWVLIPVLRLGTLPRYLYAVLLFLSSIPFLFREAGIIASRHLNARVWRGWPAFMMTTLRVLVLRLALLGLVLLLVSIIPGLLNLFIPTGLMIAAVVVLAFLVTVQCATTLTLTAGLQLTKEVWPSVLLASWCFAIILVSALPVL